MERSINYKIGRILIYVGAPACAFAVIGLAISAFFVLMGTSSLFDHHEIPDEIKGSGVIASVCLVPFILEWFYLRIANKKIKPMAELIFFITAACLIIWLLVLALNAFFKTSEMSGRNMLGIFACYLAAHLVCYAFALMALIKQLNKPRSIQTS